MRHLLLSITTLFLLAALPAAAAVINVPADQPTIASGLAAAAVGDTVLVADGIHVQSGTLNVTQGVTLTGASEAGCVIDASAVGGYGISVAASDVTLESFTMLPTAVNFPIHASGTTNPPNGFDNLTIRSVTIVGAHQRTAFDVHGYNNVVLSGLTAGDATGGNGFQVTGCVNVDADNLVSSANAWGSFAIYCSGPSYLNRACDDVVIDGDSCSFGETYVYRQDEFGLVNTNVSVTGYDFLVRNLAFRPDAAGFYMFQDTAPEAIALALFLDGYGLGSWIESLIDGSLLVGAGMDLQTAIDAADPGDTVNVADGTYVQTNTLSVTKALTLSGASEIGCVIDATAVAGYGFSVAASDVTLENFTLLPTAVNYPIHASGTSNPPNGFDNLALQNISIVGVHQRTAFDVHGYNNVVLSHLTAGDATGGNGFQVTGCNNVDADNLTSTGNAWGSLAIYCSGPSYLNRACDDVVIDGDSSVFAEKGVFRQDEFGLVSTNVSVTGYDFLVRNLVFRPDAAGFFMYQDTAIDAVALALVLDGAAVGSWIENLLDGSFLVEAGMTIQPAIDAADPGDLINVGAGTFEEQLNIAKGIEIAGAGVGSTTVLSPVTLTDFFTSSAENYPIVHVHDTDGVNIHDLTVDGGGRGNANYRFLGVSFFMAGGTVQNCDIVNVMDTPFSGAQHGNALYAWNDAGTAHTVNAIGVSASAYQKGGLVFNGSLGTVNLTDCVATGAGQTTVTAQNGIQIGYGTGGTVVNCNSSGHIYTGGGWASAGALFYLSGDVDVSGGSVFQDNSPGVYAQEMGGSITGGTITNLDPESWDAMYVITSGAVLANPGKVRAASPLMENGNGGANGDRVDRSFSLDGVSIVGHGKADSWGLYFGSSGDDLSIDMTGCTVSDWDYGLYTSEAGGTVHSLASGNTIANNAVYGWFAEGPTDQDARNNWWGRASGPYHAVLNPGGTMNEVSDFVLFDPWVGMADLTLSPLSSGPVNCDDTVSIDFSFTPNDSTPAMRGYSFHVLASAELSFDASDVTVYTLPPGALTTVQVLDNGPNDVTIDYAIMGATPGITTAETLFSVDFHPVSDGSGVVSVASAMLRDLDNVDIGANLPGDAAIEVDCTAPGLAAGIGAEPGNQKVTVTWTDPAPVDFTGVEIWRGMWHDGSNNSAYPEYDDLPGSTIPVRPADRATALASVEWTLAGTVLPGDESFVDSFAPRGAYFYEVFAVDAAFNYGGPAALNAGATNYWLGDVQSGYDGDVDIGDVTVLGAAYGTDDGEPGYNNECDIGRTDDGSSRGIPLTDNVIDFEDLILFAVNFGFVTPRQPATDGTEIAQLSWYQVDESTWALGLLEPCGNLKGIRVSADLPAGIEIELSAGPLVARQASPVFLQNAGGLDVGFALLGEGAVLAGEGELFRVSASSPLDLRQVELTARGSRNEPVEIELSATEIADLPAAYRLAGNFPNPFNPKTNIRFDLPAAQSVRLDVYGPDGRHVVTLVDGQMPAGYHSVAWNGRDGSGGAVASGVYFYRIEAGPLRQTSKMLLLK